MIVIFTTADGKAYQTKDGSLYAFDSDCFITDRTSQDVARWKLLHDKGWEAMSQEEQTEWLTGMKGSYNYTDMNRVESAVEYLEIRFLEKGTKLSLTTKTDWTNTARPTKDDMRRYFRNVAAIRAAVKVNLGTPAAPTAETLFDYKKANDIEVILRAVDGWLNKVDSCQMYSGDLYLGEV